MTEQKNFDVVVIGAGVVGCAIAHGLAARRMRVAVVEAHGVGQGTSSNTFAWINATSKTSNEAYHRINALGAELYRDLACEWLLSRRARRAGHRVALRRMGKDNPAGP